MLRPVMEYKQLASVAITTTFHFLHFENKTPDWREAPNPFHPVIHYVDAPAGVGKTSMAVDYIKEQLPLMESNFLMAVPSLHLLREIESRMKSKDMTPVVIVHDDPVPDREGHRPTHRILR